MGLDIALLGGLVVTRDGEPVDIRAPKQRALLALLALEHGSSVPAERLIDALWGVTPPRTVAKNLQVLVGRLRASLEDQRDVLESTADGYRIDADRCSIDICGFERLVARGRAAVERSDWRAGSDDLRTALALWRGDSLGSYELEEWALPHVARLQDLRVSALEGALHADLELGRHDDVLAELEQAVVTHPVRERFRALHMLALYRAGRQADALDSFHAARAALDELGLEPGPDLRALQRRILEQDPGLTLTRASSTHRGSVVPRPRTAMIGREAVMRALTESLLGRDAPRLMTITGWAGVGKTRIATELAHVVADVFDDVVWVELAPVSSDDGVVDEIAACLGIRASHGDVAESIIQSLDGRRTLLVLDNFEHVLDQALIVDRLLAACPSLLVVVTSRVALGLYGEHLHAVEPLGMPSPVELADPDFDIRSSPALVLFDERARAVGSPERLNRENASIITAVCARVDGLPLAIELAAARTALLSPQEILSRLDGRLELLGNGPSDRSPRQRSLRAAIEWSYDLLDERDQAIFRAIGAFRGGFTVESVVAVVESERAISVLDGLERLLAHGLVHRRRDAAGRPRLMQLETIAEYARERLAKDPQAFRIHRAHATEMLSQLVAAEPVMHSDVAARNAVRVELPNIRAAFDWAEKHAETLAIELIEQLTSFILRDGWFVEGAALADRASMLDAVNGPTAKIQLLAGRIAHYRGNSEQCREHLESAAVRFEDEGDLHGLAAALNGLGECSLMAQRFEESQAYFERSLEIARTVDDAWMHAMAIGNLGNVHLDLEQLDDAERRFRAAAVEFDALGDELWGICMRMNVGCVQWCRGDNATALEAFRRAAIEQAACGHHAFAVQARGNEVRALLETGNWSEATAIGARAAEDARLLGDGLVLIHVLSLLTVAHFEAGNVDRAAEVAIEAVERAIAADRVRYIYFATSVLALVAMEQSQATVANLWRSATDDTCFDETKVDQLLASHLRRYWPDGAPIDTDIDLPTRCEHALSAWRHARI